MTKSEQIKELTAQLIAAVRRVAGDLTANDDTPERPSFSGESEPDNIVAFPAPVPSEEEVIAHLEHSIEQMNALADEAEAARRSPPPGAH